MGPSWWSEANDNKTMGVPVLWTSPELKVKQMEVKEEGLGRK